MLERLERGIVEPEARHDAWAEVLDHDVGGGDQPAEGIATLGRFQIQRDGAFSRVLREKGGAHAAPIEFGIGPQLARQVTGARHLDLDHLGAEQRQLIAAERAGEHVGQVEDPRTGEKSGHAFRAPIVAQACASFCLSEYSSS